MNKDISKIKIVRIISRLNIGGPAIHTILLNSELNKCGYDDILLCGKAADSEGDMMDLADAKKVSPVMIPAMGREISLTKDLKAFFSIYSIIRKNRPDVVHTHAAKAGALGRMAAFLSGVPVKIHTFHGHIFDGYFSPAKARVFTLIEKFLACFSDKVVVVSDGVRDEIVNKLKIVPPQKCVVVKLGLELDKFINAKARGNFRKSIEVGEDEILVGIVGRLVPIKNHRMFLDAARDVMAGSPGVKVRFIVVGDGELRGSLETYAKELGLGSAVIFTGWVRELADVYEDLDVVALTSLNEGTPVSLIEAMASARPVISTNVGGVKDLIRDGGNGYLVESRDVKGFSDKLLSLIKDSGKRIEFGSVGRESVCKAYSKARLVDDIKKLYTECLTAKRKKQISKGS